MEIIVESVEELLFILLIMFRIIGIWLVNLVNLFKVKLNKLKVYNLLMVFVKFILVERLLLIFMIYMYMILKNLLYVIYND